MKDDSRPVLIAVIVVALGGGAFYLWRRAQPPAPPPPQVAVKQTEPPPRAPTPPDVAPGPAIKHPIEAGGSDRDRGLPALDESDDHFRKTLADLFGKKALLSLLAVDNFARGFVATVDNLPNPTAPSRMWPVQPTDGRLAVDREGAAISPQNAARYAALVRLVESADARRVVQVYRRLYPLFQQAYEDLGYPGKYFNDRVVEVIDHLRATPDVPEPIAVKRVVVEGGSEASAFYQFADPALERASAGQKILLRMGRDNSARLKAKLSEIRQLIVSRGP